MDTDARTMWRLGELRMRVQEALEKPGGPDIDEAELGISVSAEGFTIWRAHEREPKTAVPNIRKAAEDVCRLANTLCKKVAALSQAHRDAIRQCHSRQALGLAAWEQLIHHCNVLDKAGAEAEAETETETETESKHKEHLKHE